MISKLISIVRSNSSNNNVSWNSNVSIISKLYNSRGMSYKSKWKTGK